MKTKEEILKAFVFRFCEWGTSNGYCFKPFSHPPSLNDRWEHFLSETNAMEEYASQFNKPPVSDFEKLHTPMSAPSPGSVSVEEKQECPIAYFQNERGDYTLTRYDEPVAIVKVERDAFNLVNTYKSLTMRIDGQKKTIEWDQVKFKELEQEIRVLQNRIQESVKEVSREGPNPLEFYRNEVSKLREYLEVNRIGKPNQKLFDALYDHVSEQKSEIEGLKEENERLKEVIDRVKDRCASEMSNYISVKDVLEALNPKK